jgi:hypothetical protein
MWEWISRNSTVIEKDGKKFLKPLTHWPDGTPVIYIGVMADEVQQNYPDMVETGPDGLYVGFAKFLPALADCQSHKG